MLPSHWFLSPAKHKASCHLIPFIQNRFPGSNSEKIYHYLGNSAWAWHPCIGMHFTRGQKAMLLHINLIENFLLWQLTNQRQTLCSLFSPGHSPALFSLPYKSTGIKQLNSSRVSSPDPRRWEILGLKEHLEMNVSEGQGTSRRIWQNQASDTFLKRDLYPWKASDLLLFSRISNRPVSHVL